MKPGPEKYLPRVRDRNEGTARGWQWLLIVLAAPIYTFPKLRLVGLDVSCPGTVLTERIAGLLVTLPAPFVITTVKTDPSSEADMAGEV